MNDYTLVLNAGSSSLKFRVDVGPADGARQLAARGQIAGIGAAPRLTVHAPDGAVLTDTALAASAVEGRAAVGHVVDWVRARFDQARAVGVGHRIVHGGVAYGAPCLVTPDVLADLRRLIPLAPLHQPHNLDAIDVVAERLRGVPQVACFDTSFHRGRAPVTELVPLPRDVRDAGVQRYGFHGISYEYVASVLPAVAPEVAEGRVIVAHLGNGASLCAMRARKSVDTTFGFTALDGLCMGTRPGALDPGVVLYLFQTMGRSAAEVERLLYEESGLRGISGVASDMRALLASADPAARLAIDYFVYQAAKQIGALAAVLGGLDALVFTAGIGEHSAEIRRRVAEASGWLGAALDADANAAHATRISSAASRVAMLVVPTDEEQMIARHMAALLGR